MDNTFTASAKIILLGEHAVVYGKPSIAVPLSTLRTQAKVTSLRPGSGLRITASDLDNRLFIVDTSSRNAEDPITVASWLMLDYLGLPPPDANIVLHSDIPVASGMGSGAALTTALFRALLGALNKTLPDDQLNELVYEVEKVHHGTPSGVDNTVIVYEQPVYFTRGIAPQRLKVMKPFSLLIADTGVSASTKVAVSDVRNLYDSQRQFTQKLIDSIGELVLGGRRAIENNEIIKLGNIMNRNHQFLQDLTVSSSSLDALVQTARKAGAIGAKLTGGGRGGNMISLVTPDSLDSVRASLLAAGAAHIYETIVH